MDGSRTFGARARGVATAAGVAALLGAGLAYADAGGGRGDPHGEVQETVVVRFPPGETPIEVAGSRAATGAVVVTAEVPRGAWQVMHQVEAGRNAGGGLVFCGVRDPAVAGVVNTLSRAALGTDPGFVREATTTAIGTIEVGPGGTTLELRCWNFGGSWGEPARVFLGVLQVSKTSRVTSTEQP